MALHAEILSGLNEQANHVLKNGAPGTAAICRALIALAHGNSLCGRRIANWDSQMVLRDAMPLRLAGGFHDLFRRGVEPGLGKIYSGEVSDQAAVDQIVIDIVEQHDAELLPWFDSPPQTNEAGRSSSFVAALHWLANRVTPHVELNEIGSSAGMNLLIDRYRYDLGGVVSGPADSPVIIRPIWNGPPPPSDPFDIVSVQGCDIQPIDVRDDAAANRLIAYIWPEMPERFTRMKAGIDMIRALPVDLVQADAADFVEARLAAPQAAGTTRVLMHSIVWQYLPDAVQHRIKKAMADVGAKATPEKPLAWISLETNRATFRHELKVSYWPGGGKPVMLGEAHAHGAWVNWLGV
ncbi:DUF2332 domain-containing protein [Nostoc sp. CHAB 5834]|nr:DUF2332 domain-containing protein [Nostoc sp. CHAB 5834]